VSFRVTNVGVASGRRAAARHHVVTAGFSAEALRTCMRSRHTAGIVTNAARLVTRANDLAGVDGIGPFLSRGRFEISAGTTGTAAPRFVRPPDRPRLAPRLRRRQDHLAKNAFQSRQISPVSFLREYRAALIFSRHKLIGSEQIKCSQTFIWRWPRKSNAHTYCRGSLVVS
jgi:hypothetical protein